MNGQRRLDLTHDLILPTLLFAALGGMTWAVRGSSGYGGSAGCIFAGVMWGAAWWFIARDPTRAQSRRYASAWIVLALTVGIGLSGDRGWMQWPTFFEGKLQTHYRRGEFVPISRTYGFVWLFIAGMPWAGIGACALAWCGSLRETRAWQWAVRIALGIGAAVLARFLFYKFPAYFLPLYETYEARYNDLQANPNLGRLINDNRLAVAHLGCYLGFLLFEVLRRDWKNVVLIATVGIVNGTGWALLQNWKWAPGVWGDAGFNFWRCWESSGGISIGVAYGIAYFLVNRRMSAEERAIVAERRSLQGPNFEWLVVSLSLAWLAWIFVAGDIAGWFFADLRWLLAQFLDREAAGQYLPMWMARWGGNLYFATVTAFAGAYYLLNRKTPVDGVRERWWPTAMLTNFELGAVVLTAGVIAGFFAPWLRAMEYGRRYLQDRGDVFYAATLISLAIVLTVGLAWYFIRENAFDAERDWSTPPDGDPNLERLGLYLGLLAGLGLSIRNGLKGWFNVYKGDEDYWSRVLWQILGPAYLVLLIAILAWVLFRPLPRNFRGNVFPHAYALVWLVLIVQNVLAQLITGPLTDWNEMAFNIYYVLLFAISAVIVVHYYSMKINIASIER